MIYFIIYTLAIQKKTKHPRYVIHSHSTYRIHV